MDASNRHYLLNGKQVPRGDLTPEDWQEVIGRILSICRPGLKYWPGFTPIRELKIGGEIVDPSIISFYRGISLKTFCLFLSCCESSVSYSDLPPGRSGEKRRRLSWSDIFLTRKGQFIERRVANVLTYFFVEVESVRPLSSVESCQYLLLDEAEFSDFLKPRPDCSFGIVMALYQIMNGAVEVAEGHYLGFKHQRDLASEIVKRIN